jgi:hypothetical protein
LLKELRAEFGWKSRLVSLLAGPYVYWKLRREEKRLAAGWTYEPPTFYEKNAACHDAAAAPCRYVTPQIAPPSAKKGGKLPQLAEV